jgi:hypothetical protein
VDACIDFEEQNLQIVEAILSMFPEATTVFPECHEKWD